MGRAACPGGRAGGDLLALGCLRSGEGPEATAGRWGGVKAASRRLWGAPAALGEGLASVMTFGVRILPALVSPFLGSCARPEGWGPELSEEVSW